MAFQKIAVIVGAGPAGLTTAYELLHRTNIKPIIYEMTDVVGGICRTVNYKGNRMDIGGHRFFSKSDRVVKWWQNILPVQGAPTKEDVLLDISYQGQKRPVYLSNGGPDPEKTDKVMLMRRRYSRIFFLRKFFKYPISLSPRTLLNLGLIRAIRIIWSYLMAKLKPIKPELSLRDFLINRFGQELYLTFFRSYTEKVWGVPCHQIKAEWGAQRIKGLDLRKAIFNQVRALISKDPSILQKHVETSLIERFMYPKYGPGQMWEEVAKKVKEKGGEIYFHWKAIDIKLEDGQISEIRFRDEQSNEIRSQRLDYLFSTMPVKDLIRSFGDFAPLNVRKVADGLMYRDFVAVGILLKKIKVKNETNISTLNNLPPDNWIYIQDRDVRVGRIQIYNNWSPYLVKDKDTIWIGMEYFCNEGDSLWRRSDPTFIKFAIGELEKMGIADKQDVLDTTIVRMLKTYPAYFGSYDHFSVIRKFTDQIENLFLIGRNGMHKYNNQDHSMLAAMVAVDNIVGNVKTKDNIWSVNTELEYQEEK
jgi:protoporphyrinogen oxidase